MAAKKSTKGTKVKATKPKPTTTSEFSAQTEKAVQRLIKANKKAAGK